MTVVACGKTEFSTHVMYWLFVLTTKKRHFCCENFLHVQILTKFVHNENFLIEI